MKIISFTAIFIAVLIVTVLSTNSAVSAMNTGSLKMHSESSPVVLVVNNDQLPEIVWSVGQAR